MDAAAELGRNPVSKHQIHPGYRYIGWRGTGLPKPSRETKFSGSNVDREKNIIMPVQLTTSRIGNLTQLILTPAIYVTMHTYIHYSRYFPHAHFIPVVGVGKRGAY